MSLIESEKLTPEQEMLSQRKKSEGHFKISTFLSLLKKKKEILRDLEFGEMESKDSNYRFRVAWGKETFNDWPGPFYDTTSLMRYKTILMMFSPTGDLWIQGNFLGRSFLRAEKWKDNPAVQEKALEKGFRHPGHENHPFNRPGYI